MKNILIIIMTAVLLHGLSQQAFCTKNPVKVGQNLSELTFNAPYTLEEQTYLGITDQQNFTLNDLDADFFLIEVVGAYCPVCHAQSTEINHLFNRIIRDEKLGQRMLMFSVSPGSTKMEIEYLKSTWNAPYPILEDYDYVFHKALGNPDTPFTLIVSQDGMVHYAHLGRIPELSVFLEKIRMIVQ